MARAILSPAVEVEYSFILKYKDNCKWKCNDEVTSPVLDDEGWHRFEGVGYVNGISAHNGIDGITDITVYVMTYDKIKV